ncbi:pantetheine-phosphate adenylyltransferase [Kytococcus sedentarius]|uniref:pantetheine-phosphate adenylyltransferase n=1 Tax=Kytococcus sedentarius TaxID=1276 RepID=UPI0035BBDD31
MTTTALLPGSYDPLTNGHLDVVRRAAALYDRVVVAVVHNPAKTGTLEVPVRVRVIEESVADLPGVEVSAHTGLLVDVARAVGADVVVKGIRSETDYAYEHPMAAMNRHLSGIETLLLPADGAVAHISSTLVRQISAAGGDVTELVPEPVRRALTELS